jgi:undecaprenyl-diphosphatase
MNIVEGLILGALQGIIEWLPISSSGQTMILLINFFNIPPEEAFSISVMLHLGSLLALIFYFRGRFRSLLSKDRSYLGFLVIATLMSGFVGFPVFIFFRDSLSAVSGEAVTMFIGVMLIFTGLILMNQGKESRYYLFKGDAIVTGAAQGLAVLPGISRSGTTIAAMLLKGVNQELALTLSFLLAAPAILGLVIIESVESGFSVITPPILAGIGSSFVVSLATMHYFLALAKKVDFSKFVIAVGVIAFFVPLIFMIIESLF